jgi:lysine-N-methylase
MCLVEPDLAMPLPVRHLPVLQNWDCQGCSNCCREYQIGVTEDERRAIEEQGWADDPALDGLPLFQAKGPWWARRYQLNHRTDGACVFLSPEGRCRIHERFGAAAKPLACRLYPFVLVPAGDHWRVGLRFACPSASANQGRPLAEHQDQLAEYSRLLERQTGVDGEGPAPPALQMGQHVEWPDWLRFVKALLDILGNRADRFEQRMRKCLALASICRQAHFDKVKGGQLSEFLRLVESALDEDVKAMQVSPPTWAGRILFRQAAAMYVRKDHGPQRNLVRGRFELIGAAWRFARGTGTVPRVHGWLPEATTFEQAEHPGGVLPQSADQILERYYLVKVSSLQFSGATHFGFSLWQGVDELALSLAVILWAMRVMHDVSREEAAVRAVGMVDHNFGFNPLFGTLRHRYSLSILGRRAELGKLIAWYSR